jgi:hypothetical protein
VASGRSGTLLLSVCDVILLYLSSTGVRLCRTQDHSSWRLGGQGTLLLSVCEVISCYLSSTGMRLSRTQDHSAWRLGG